MPETTSNSRHEARVYPWADQPVDRPIPTIQRRKVVAEKSMVANVILEKGCVVPSHHHENEQIACVLSGHLRFTIGDPDSPEAKQMDIKGGEVLHLPSNVPHGCVAMEETVVLDVFTPVAERMGIDQGKS